MGKDRRCSRSRDRRSRSKRRRERSRSRSMSSSNRCYKKRKAGKNDFLDLKRRLEYLERKASKSLSRDRSPRGSAYRTYSYSSRGYKSPSHSERGVSVSLATEASTSYSEVPDRSPGDSARHSKHSSVTPCDSTPIQKPNSISPEVSPNGGHDTLQLRLDEETLVSLGLNLAGKEGKKVSLHPDLAKSWANNVKKGVPEKGECMEALLKEFPIPENCADIRAPELNKDIRHMFIHSVNKKDHAVIKKDNIRVENQNKLGACIAGVGEIITDILDSENNHILKAYLRKLGKIGTILTDLQHDILVSRRVTISCFLSKEAKQAAEESELDCYLFGSDFTEKFKSLQVLNRSSKDLKADFSAANNNLFPKKPSANFSSSKVPLNRKGPSRNLREMQRQKGHNPRVRYPQERGSRRKSYRQ